MSVAVVLAFFQPVAFELPRRHFHATLQTLNAVGVPLVVAQAVFPGQQPQPVPESVPQLVYRLPSVIWAKEALWNAAATSTTAEYLVFLDADVVFSESAWLDRTVETLQRCDITQPFGRCRWLDRAGRVELHKTAAVASLPDKAPPQMQTYHPGFGWAMTRDAFDRLGGLYDLNACGGNDSALLFALSNHTDSERYIGWFGKRQDRTVVSQSWRAYRDNAQAQQFRYGVTEGMITHLWHGDRKDRQYQTREASFRRNAQGEFDLRRRPDGMLEWIYPADAKAAEAYFLARRDDG